MRVIEVKKVQPQAGPSFFIETVKTFAAVAVCASLYILLAAAF